MLCMIFGAAFVATQLIPGLLALSAVAFAGALLPRHPFDYLYIALVNPLLKTGPVPRNTPRRRFACAVGASFLAGTAAFFAGGYDVAAIALGLFFVAVALVVSVTNWCLPSFIYNKLLTRIGFPTSSA